MTDREEKPLLDYSESSAFRVVDGEPRLIMESLSKSGLEPDDRDE